MNSTSRFSVQDNVIRAENSALVLIDYQTLLLLGIQTHDRSQLTRNVVGLARAARTFEVPTLLTTMATRDFGGPLVPELREVCGDLRLGTRTAINPWDDESFVATVKQLRRKKLIIAGLRSEVSLSLPVFSALEEGYTVYFVADTCGGNSAEAHQIALQQLVQAGARPRTWQQLLYSWQRDWARLDTADAVQDIIQRHGSAFPPSAIYAKGLSIGNEDERVLQVPRRGLRPAGMGR